jgi:UDP-N-acetylmuramyl pentapeptide phosphotransferase/UDP-N-acetylglucosamine-1-phosphate transferase
MEFSNEHFTFFFPAWSLIVAGTLLAFLITWSAIPSIVDVARAKGLNGKPNGRSSHKDNIPLLGGVAVFAGLVLSTVVIAGVGFVYELKYIIAGLIILFFIGVKDDILIIDPKKKLVGQILASLIIIILGDIRIINFHGFEGIGDVSYFVSIIFTLFVFIVIINGFNLIDGIDGLASGVGIITSVTFGIWFWLAGHIPYVVFSFSLAGSLVAFFYFNVFSKKSKIFLGDTGSLIIGLTMAVIVVRFLQYEVNAMGAALAPATTAVAIGIIIVPLFDTFRVFTIRIVNGRSPFKADRLHVHHRLLDLGFSHLKATSIILGVNVLIIILTLLLRNIGNMTLFMIIFCLASILSYIPVAMVNRNQRKAWSVKKAGDDLELSIEHRERSQEKKA